MSKFYNSKKVLSFRQFDKLDTDVYTTYDIAWPVEVIECLANKVSDGLLDALAETVLELLTVPETNIKEISKLLDISNEIVEKIIKVLNKSEYYDMTTKQVTNKGKDYIKKRDTTEFLEEKVFGNMFVSRVNGEVFPFFREGKLPWGREYNDILYLSYDGSEPSTLKGKRVGVLDKVNRAFHEYGKITKSSKEQARIYSDYETIEFIEEELHERAYNDEITIDDEKQKSNLKNARIKLLNTKPLEIYVRCRLCVSKASPEKYIIESPFPENFTPWYSQSFNRLINNDELIYLNDNEETSLKYFCEEMVTKQFYIDFPEMQSNNFEQYIKIQFPKMVSCSISNICMKKYHEVFNYKLLCEDQKVKRHTVITEATKALELILNNYIVQTRKNEIVEKYRKNVKTYREIEALFDEFQIWECSAKWAEGNKVNNGRLEFEFSCMSHFKRNKNGNSIIEKYYFLVAEANYNEKSKFRKLLKSEGKDIIEYLDFINNIRNKFGAHNNGIKVDEVSDEIYAKFDDYHKKATQLLLEYID